MCSDQLQAIQSGDVVRYLKEDGQEARATVSGFRLTTNGGHMLQVLHSRRAEIPLEVVLSRSRLVLGRGPETITFDDGEGV